MTEMETKILASIEGIKNEMNEIKTEQDATKKQIRTIKQVFSYSVTITNNNFNVSLYPTAKITFLGRIWKRLKQGSWLPSPMPLNVKKINWMRSKVVSLLLSKLLLFSRETKVT